MDNGQWTIDNQTMDRWLARLSMSFFVIFAVLAWSAFQALQQHAAMWRVVIDLFAAAAAFAMGATGTRIKHRGKYGDK